MERKIINLYETYKNTPKKLKIVCGWDEVIQACEPFALYLERGEKIRKEIDFPRFFTMFWEGKSVEYSPYGSKFISWSDEIVEEQEKSKNSPNFYQEAPFLTIAEDLLNLIREDKVDKLVFLSAYDKSEFPNGDDRKKEIFKETFGKLGEITKYSNELGEYKLSSSFSCEIELMLIGFENETQGQTKADWIKENAADFDIFIDDNPIICRSLIEINRIVVEPCKDCSVEYEKATWILGKIMPYGKFGCISGNCEKINITIIAPYYPAIEHDKRVLLVKNEVSGLKKEDFKI